jgi:hypothetical protein
MKKEKDKRREGGVGWLANQRKKQKRKKRPLAAYEKTLLSF